MKVTLMKIYHETGKASVWRLSTFKLDRGYNLSLSKKKKKILLNVYLEVLSVVFDTVCAKVCLLLLGLRPYARLPC